MPLCEKAEVEAKVEDRPPIPRIPERELGLSLDL